MCVPQLRQRPRRRSQDTTGTLSYHAISCSQTMQAEGGWTTDRRSGTRAATTFRNEPSARPGAKASAARTTGLTPAALLGHDRLDLVVGGGHAGQQGPYRHVVVHG